MSFHPRCFHQYQIANPTAMTIAYVVHGVAVDVPAADAVVPVASSPDNVVFGTVTLADVPTGVTAALAAAAAAAAAL